MSHFLNFGHKNQISQTQSLYIVNNIASHENIDIAMSSSQKWTENGGVRYMYVELTFLQCPIYEIRSLNVYVDVDFHVHAHVILHANAHVHLHVLAT
jgi:uncharacterized protein (UPF0212 family)